MRVKFTHGIAHDSGALAIWFVGADSQLGHIIQSPPLHRLESIPDVWKRT